MTCARFLIREINGSRLSSKMKCKVGRGSTDRT